MSKEQSIAPALTVCPPAENELAAVGYAIEFFKRIVVNRQDVDSLLDIDARKLSLPKYRSHQCTAELAFLAGYRAGRHDAENRSTT